MMRKRGMTVERTGREESGRGRDTVKLTYRQIGSASEAAKAPRTIDTLRLEDLLDMVGATPDERSRLAGRMKTFWFADGFQSWSPGWELGFFSRHPRVKLRRVLEMFSLPDGRPPSCRELAAHGIAYLRGGDTYLALISTNKGTPPVTYRINRLRRRIAVEIACTGTRYEDGETLAEISVIIRIGYFAFADAIRMLFLELHCMRRAAFLGSPADSFLVTGGWESWYNHYTHINEKLIQEDLEGLASSPNLIRELFNRQGRPVVFQIDDGWQLDIGDWRPDPGRFPSGMRALAEAIAAKGYIPGLWLAPFLVGPTARICREKPGWLLHADNGALRLAGWNPNWDGDFHCLDISRADVREYLRAVFDTVINLWGFRYIKCDFLYAGMLSGRHHAGGAAFRWYREALQPIVSIQQSKAGKPVAFLGCGAPLESSVDLFPLMRVGADTCETWDRWLTRAIGHLARPSAYVNLKDTLGRAFMNRSMFLSDPDVVFMRSANCSLTESEKELIAAVAIMFSSQIMISDDVSRFGGPGEAERTRNTLRLYGRLSGREFGAVMIGRDLWRCFSRDGEVRGIINVRGGALRIGAKDVKGWSLTGESLTARAVPDGDGILVEPRSVALWCGR
jgi:alpha-galactosidase